MLGDRLEEIDGRGGAIAVVGDGERVDEQAAGISRAGGKRLRQPEIRISGLEGGAIGRRVIGGIEVGNGAGDGDGVGGLIDAVGDGDHDRDGEDPGRRGVGGKCANVQEAGRAGRVGWGAGPAGRARRRVERRVRGNRLPKDGTGSISWPAIGDS